MTQEFVTLTREVVEQALEAWARGCPPDCKDGMTDSGGVHPWGEAALIECPSCQAAEALRAALDQPQNHVPDAENMAPAGWKLVPVEPTAEMQAGYLKAMSAPWVGRYRDMLAAAPQPTTVKHSLTVEQPQGEQEPVAWMYAVDGEDEPRLHFYEPLAANNVSRITPLYTHPQPKRQPLTDEQIDAIADAMPGGLEGFLKGWGWRQFARAVLEAAHNIK